MAFLRERGGDCGLDMNEIRGIFNRVDLAPGMNEVDQIHPAQRDLGVDLNQTVR